jgi:hypothetical protein
MRKTLIAAALSAAMLGQPALLDTFWTFLSSLWEESSPDEGCGADPNGSCAPPPQTDAGCGADPNGCPKGS